MEDFIFMQSGFGKLKITRLKASSLIRFRFLDNFF